MFRSGTSFDARAAERGAVGQYHRGQREECDQSLLHAHDPSRAFWERFENCVEQPGFAVLDGDSDRTVPTCQAAALVTPAVQSRRADNSWHTVSGHCFAAESDAPLPCVLDSVPPKMQVSVSTVTACMFIVCSPVNKQLNDKERVAAALENNGLLVS